MIHFFNGDLLTGEPKLDALTSAGLGCMFCLTSIYIPQVPLMTIMWKEVFQNLAIVFSIGASILSINKSLGITKKISQWLKK